MGLITTDHVSKYEIKSLANRLLNDSDCLDLPIDIEFIIDYLGLNLIIADLDYDVECFIQMNFKHIFINKSKFINNKNSTSNKRLRFSLAHEVGHFILHKDLLRFWNIESVARAYNFFNEIPENEYKFIEYQADLFASHILVPDNLLKKEYNKIKKDYTTKQNLLITQLSNIFDVNEIVIKIKLENLL